MNQPLVTLKDITVRFGELVAVQDVSCAFRANEVSALIGPNGSGKSTLLRAVLGLDKYQGEIAFAINRSEIGYVPQRLDIDRSLPVTVSDFVSAMTTKRPLPLGIGARGKEKVRAVLERASAAHLIDKPFGGLSGGEQQRVMLALALEPMPKLLLLDEPATGMDINAEGMLYDIVKKLVREHGMGVVLVSHDLSVVSGLTQHVLCINRTLVCEGGPESIMTDKTIASVFGHGHGVYHHSHGGHEHHHH
ncbi:MAG: metal ABC transporter ATP-binding protein [Planctomycetes bacterium]|nr:metal ABC transporter ATP-binding protein [Planctomycetota bacterium]NUQ33471.1 metal ABC transporter ATP-binding protein [Planctomycetaceae bacterium]